jgi:glycosyltransferase involved in cell wall biosynthesis
MIDGLNLGGTETNLLRIAARLDQARFPLVVVHFDDGPLLPRFRAAGIRLQRMRLKSFKSLEIFKVARCLRALFDRERIDILHTHDVYSNVLAAFSLIGRPSPSLIVSRRWGLRQYDFSVRMSNRLAYRRARWVLANSEAVAHSLHHDEGVPRHRIVVVPNFADSNLFAPVATDTRLELQHRLGVPKDAFVVGCIANLWAGKDHATLLRAIAEVASLDVPVHAVLIGDGPERRNLEMLSGSLRISERTHFAGAIDNASVFHHAFDVSTLTSRSEGFPNTIIEAMAAGRPVVATKVGGVPDAVADGITGFLVAAGDHHAIARALLSIHREPSLATSMGELGRSIAKDRFHETPVLARLAALYEGIHHSMWNRRITSVGQPQ